MRAKRFSLTLDQGIRSELSVMQALKDIAPGRRQHRIREWLKDGLGMVAEGCKVDAFTASDLPSATIRLFIQLNEAVPEDKQVLDAMASVAERSRSLWIKCALIAGFIDRIRLDIDLSEGILHEMEESATGLGRSVDSKADPAVIDRVEKHPPFESSSDAAIVVPAMEIEGPSTATLLRNLFT